MATPPTFVASYGNVAYSTTTKTASVTMQAGDLIVVYASTDTATHFVQTPTGGGLTFKLEQQITSVAQQLDTVVWTAVSPGTQTFTMTVAGGPASTFTYFAEVWRNHGGVGSSAKKTATSTASLSLTTQGANSAIGFVTADWNGVNGSSRTYLSSVGAFAERAYQFAGAGAQTFYGGHHADSGVIGVKTVGMTAPAGQQPAMIAVEILAATTGFTGALAITASALSSNVPPAVRIDVNDTRSPGQASTLTIVRNNADGSQEVVRTTDGAPLHLSAGIGLVYDYGMPLNQPVSYTALEVPDVASPQVTVASTDAWLVHPGIPSLSTIIEMRAGSLTEEDYTLNQGVFFPMGRTNPVVVTDGARHGASSSIVLFADTPTDLAALKNILADGSPLLFNVPDASLQFGPCYIAVGDVKVTRRVDSASDPSRDVTLTFQVVDRPAGGTQSARTWADLLADYGSWRSVLSAYRSWADVLAGP